MIRCACLMLMLALVPGAKAAEPPATRIVGHRGLAGHAPEQTRASFQACVDLRLHIELDVRRTRDGQLVCVHDDSVNRTTNGTGKVVDLSLRELQKLDAGSKFDPLFSSERIISLEEVFALVHDRKAASLLIAVDLKVPDVERDVVMLAQKHGVLKQLVFIGRTIDRRDVRQKLRSASPDAVCAALCPAAAQLDTILADSTADWVYLRYIPTSDDVKRVHAAKKRVFLVGPLVMGNEPANWAKGQAAGVDALLTDYPLECRVQSRTHKKQ